MTSIVDRAIAAAGLVEVYDLRRGRRQLSPALVDRLVSADLLALGALADRVRAEEVGDEVRIYTCMDSADVTTPAGAPGSFLKPLPTPGSCLGPLPQTPPDISAEDDGSAIVSLPPADVELTGFELLRRVAIGRLTGPIAARVRVDWMRCGLELAQVALGFGANELRGRIANKRGLPIADGELAGVGKKSRLEPAQRVKQRELAGYVQRAGRVAVFIQEPLTLHATALPEARTGASSCST